jgi:hypothetical protein
MNLFEKQYHPASGLAREVERDHAEAIRSSRDDEAAGANV